MGRIVESRLVEQAAESLDDLMGGLLDAMIEAHALDPELHELLRAQVPHGTRGDRLFETRVRGALRLALSSRSHEFAGPLRMERILFVLTQLVEALAHGSVLRRPAGLSLAAAKEESARALLAYLHAHGRRASGRQGSAHGRKRRTRG